MNLFRVKLLDKLILQDLVPKFLLGVGMFSTLFFALGPLIAAARFIEQGVPAWVVVAFIGWDFAGFVSFTFPLGMLIAALLSFERLSRESEAVALFAGGIPFRRLMVPVAAVGMAVSLIGYLFNDRVASYANQRVSDIKEHRGEIIGETTKPFHFENRTEGRLQAVVEVEKGYDVQAKALRQVSITVYDATGRPSQVFYADRAKSLGNGFKSWTLFDGRSTDVTSGITTNFKKLETNEVGKTPENMTFLQRDPETLNFHDLQQQINQLRRSGGDSAEVRNAEVSLWFKVSLPFSCLVFSLVGAPLGMRSPRSSKISGAVWALPIMLGYYVIYMTMSSAARGGGISPVLAAWLPNLLGLGVGSALIWKASR